MGSQSRDNDKRRRIELNMEQIRKKFEDTMKDGVSITKIRVSDVNIRFTSRRIDEDKG